MAFGFDVDRLLVWLAPREPDGDPLRAGSLCKRHADAMVVPRGWTLDDRREPTPRALPHRARCRPPRTPPRRRRPHAEPHAADLAASRRAELGCAAGDRSARSPSVTGRRRSPTDDPDATVAIPWMPDFDQQDDLDGVLAAGSPLLARAFRGTDRPR